MPARYKSQMRPLRPAPRWLNNGAIDVEDLRGKPVLVHFWSMSVPVAVKQIPRLQSWMRRYGRELQFISVHTPLAVADMDHSRVAAAVSELGLRNPVALDGDDGALADTYDVRDSPAYFLFDAQLRLRNHRAGRGATEAMERILVRVFPRVSPERAQASEGSSDLTSDGR
jgi:hypothetical protein